MPGHPMGDAPMGLPTLLLVEDDQDTQAMMRAMLHNAFDLRVAVSADAVRNIVAEDSTIDGVLMDISLKGEEDGLRITRYLRSQARFHATPIIALTAHAAAEHQRLALEAGCDAVLSKPVRRSEILEALNRSKIFFAAR
jgi:CheY-like chemotaxis protein